MRYNQRRRPDMPESSDWYRLNPEDEGSVASPALLLYVDRIEGEDGRGDGQGEGAAAVYRAVGRSAGLVAGGLHAYDGHLQSADEAWLTRSAASAFAPVAALRERLLGEGLAVPRVVASGTPT